MSPDADFFAVGRRLLQTVTRIAEQHRPDSLALRRRIRQAEADVDLDGLLGAHEAFRDAVEVSIDGQADYWRAWHQVNIVAGTRVLD